MNNLLKGLIIVIFSTLFGSCSSHQGIESVTADGLENALYDGHVRLLDVRSAEEYAQGHIANAEDIDVQQPDFIEKAQVKLDHINPVYVYCRSGKRSMLAAQELARAGFKVVNLHDGTTGWKDVGKPALPQRGQVPGGTNAALDEELHSSCRMTLLWFFFNRLTM